MTTTPYDWIKHLPSSVLEMDGIPLMGFPPPFPWAQFGKQLSAILQIEGMEISASDPQWRSEEQLFEGMGAPLVPLHISIATLAGDLSWVMSQDDIRKLMSLVLTKKENGIPLWDPEYEKGFYTFIALETINALGKVEFDKTISPHILPSAELPNTPAMCLDLSITLLGTTLTGRLLLSKEFRQSWKERYANRKLDLAITSPLLQQVQLIVNLEAGKTSLTLAEWSAVKPGDFLLLDSCSLEPGEDKGRIMLTINGVPFFRGKVKEGNIKILEYPLFHEVDTTMSNPPPEDDEEETEFEDEFQDEEELEEIEEEVEAAPAPQASQAAKPGTLVEAKGVPSPQEIPFSVIVEVGRLQMSIKQLMDLQPGNILDLNIHPENGVDLIVNGKRIAKGELLKIGDSLGVRVLDIG